MRVRSKDPETVTVRIERNKGVAEVHPGRLLSDHKAATPPVRVKRIHPRLIRDGEGQLHAPSWRQRGRLDRVP